MVSKVLASTMKPIPLGTLRLLRHLEVPQDPGRKPKMGLVSDRKPDWGFDHFSGAGVNVVSKTPGDPEMP